MTDRGHIENVDLYELLKRHCRVIIVIDAEADPQMAFGSLGRRDSDPRRRAGVVRLGYRITTPQEVTRDDPLRYGRACGSRPVVR